MLNYINFSFSWNVLPSQALYYSITPNVLRLWSHVSMNVHMGASLRKPANPLLFHVLWVEEPHCLYTIVPSTFRNLKCYQQSMGSGIASLLCIPGQEAD